jgi:hypothetical protein
VKPPLDVIEEPPGAGRSVGRLRLVAAASVCVASAWMLWASRGALVAWVVVAASLFAVAFWWRSFVGTERVAHLGRRLSLTTEGIELAGPGGFRLDWSSVERIEIDHDRLVLRVVPRAGDVHEIEPPLGGVGLVALAERVARARQAAAGASPANASPP